MTDARLSPLEEALVRALVRAIEGELRAEPVQTTTPGRDQRRRGQGTTSDASPIIPHAS